MNKENGSCDCNVDYVRNTLTGECEPTCEKRGLKTSGSGVCYKCDPTELVDHFGVCYCPEETYKDKGKCINCPEDTIFSKERNECIPKPCEQKRKD